MFATKILKQFLLEKRKLEEEIESLSSNIARIKLAVRKIRTLINYNCKQYNTKTCGVYKQILSILNKGFDEKGTPKSTDSINAATKALKILKNKIPNYNDKIVGRQIGELLLLVINTLEGEQP